MDEVQIDGRLNNYLEKQKGQHQFINTFADIKACIYKIYAASLRKESVEFLVQI